ncbi:uncharacterized protein LOC127247719 [Andrographis paniculata]|uniref:uncharacterized protein LOC127247719 n=1 Tax=Andrographis paniculata TaxID=175694 RepID=UPI0021E978CD|nr:uncharacterized protein LOC127247719 [Andrographis paniculata]
MGEMSSSDSETSVNLGPRSAPQRPFAAADESAAVIPAVCPTRPTSLLPPSLTAVRPEVPHIFSEQICNSLGIFIDIVGLAGAFGLSCPIDCSGSSGGPDCVH